MNYPLRIVHEEHGAMHVYNSAEWEAHKARGWKPEVKEPAEAGFSSPEPKKPGRKPKAPA